MNRSTDVLRECAAFGLRRELLGAEADAARLLEQYRRGSQWAVEEVLRIRAASSALLFD